MSVLDVAQRQAQTLKEVQEQLLEFFTSLKLVRLEGVRAIIDKYALLPFPPLLSLSLSSSFSSALYLLS